MLLPLLLLTKFEATESAFVSAFRLVVVLMFARAVILLLVMSDTRQTFLPIRLVLALLPPT